MFITDYPAMHIRGFVVIADVHLGMSRELSERGVKVPDQAKRLAEKANRLQEITGAKSMVILGDMKHQIPMTSYGETHEIVEFLSLLRFRRIIVTKGNHDGGIEKFVSGIKNVKVRKSVAVGDYLLTHGHRNVSTAKKSIVIGHNHPNVKLIDKLGASYVMPCWVIGKLKSVHRVIIMPSFNDFAGTMTVNSGNYRHFNGPVAKHMNKGNAKVYLLDGTCLGKIKDIMVKGK